MNTRIVNGVARTGEKVRYTQIFDENGKIQPSLIPQGYDNIEKGYLHEGVFYAKFEGGVYSEPYTPQEEVLYVDKADGHKYLWNGTAYEDYNADIYEALEGKYEKPTTGIPKSDLAEGVKESLEKADSALQEHQSLSEYRKAEAQNAIDAQFSKKDGYYQTLSAGYADKAGDLDIQTSAMVRHTQTKPMETTGGDKDVKDGAGFIRVVKGTENGITAAGAKIISLGFNLIPSGNGTSFTFRCVKGEWGAYGTSAKNNGYLFTDSQGNILVPSSVKQNGVAVPTHTDHGNTYYLPSQDGQCTVVFAASQTNPCAHLCWSNGRDTKDNYEAYNASQVDLASAINAIGGTLRRVGYVFDEINLETKQSIRRIGYRLLNALSWTMEAGPTPEEGEATNTFRAIVSGGVATADTIKAGGAFAIKGLSGLTFNLDGTSLVCDSTIASVADFVTALGSGTVEYELAVEVVASNTLNGQITISDYGIIIFENTAGASVVDIDFDFDTKWRDFIKNLPNDLEQMNEATGSINNNIEAIAEDLRGMRDIAALPLLCGQPPVLYGAGAPAESVIPDNWKQFDPATGEGYNWNGNPSAIGQRYINVSAANGGYTAGRKSLDKASADYYVLKWYKD